MRALHDLVIRNGKIVDGSGKKPFHGDVAIDNGKISAVGIVENPVKRKLTRKVTLSLLDG